MDYELVVVFEGDLNESEVKEHVLKLEGFITDHGGTISTTDVWGKRLLAYPINKKMHGNYVLFWISGPGIMLKELVRYMEINESVIRHLMVKRDQHAPTLTDRVRESNAQSAMGSNNRSGAMSPYDADMQADY